MSVLIKAGKISAALILGMIVWFLVNGILFAILKPTILSDRMAATLFILRMIRIFAGLCAGISMELAVRRVQFYALVLGVFLALGMFWSAMDLNEPVTHLGDLGAYLRLSLVFVVTYVAPFFLGSLLVSRLRERRASNRRRRVHP